MLKTVLIQFLIKTKLKSRKKNCFTKKHRLAIKLLFISLLFNYAQILTFNANIKAYDLCEKQLSLLQLTFFAFFPSLLLFFGNQMRPLIYNLITFCFTDLKKFFGREMVFELKHLEKVFFNFFTLVIKTSGHILFSI